MQVIPDPVGRVRQITWIINPHQVNNLPVDGTCATKAQRYARSPRFVYSFVNRAHDSGQVHVEKLVCNTEQRSAIDALYLTQSEQRFTFNSTAASQASAEQMLKIHGLDHASLKQLEKRWKVVWTTRACGYSTTARQAAFESRNGIHKKGGAWARCAPYDFTGCLAHADITYDNVSGHTFRILGLLQHNEECQDSAMKRMPAIPLHQHVFEVALQQLKQGATITAIQMRNVEMCKAQAYRDQRLSDPMQANQRYHLEASDFSRLYVLHHRTNGIDVKRPAELNVDNWLNKSSRSFQKDVFNAIFHYSPRTSASERFELFISTSEMEEAAWMHVHNSQLILDGTFGISSSRLLLWIAMGLDSDRRGLPVALFLFSAPAGALATHAGYDTEIVSRLLTTWKTWLSSRPSAKGRVFEPAVAITDTDAKERGALIATWPSITLLLCKFHLRQCWTNKRIHLLRLYSQLKCTCAINRLIQSTHHETAKAAVAAERQHFLKLQGDRSSKPSADKGLAFLAYLDSFWMRKDMWRSWSQSGRVEAAARMGIPIDGVLPTTNHLEAFNGVFKNKYLPQWQRSGYRLRFDVLILHLVRHILPHIFTLVRQRGEIAAWRRARFSVAAEGAPLLRSRAGAQSTSNSSRPMAWFGNDPQRDQLAAEILRSQRLFPVISRNTNELWACCATSASHPGTKESARYWLTLHLSGVATCTCPDWLQRGGACKHLRS
ncbi:hypothetical protein BC834DRAFT_837033, partial [Gloeopeniophorella convolvens]